MGNCSFKTEKEDESVKKASKEDYTLNYVIGRGGFGKVWKCEHKKSGVQFALKEMMKARVIAKRSIASVMNEKQFLSQLYHPFLVNMKQAFQDRENLYLIIDLMQGGDLRYHLSRNRRFTQKQTRFFMACMILSLEYLHSKNILHRDVKPENLVFDQEGYLKLTDLGIGRFQKPDNSKDTSGTPGYMAPEVMCKQPHGIAVDYFAMGVIAYECMFGKRPYYGKNRKEIRDHILSKQVQIKRQDIPSGWSVEAADFINRLIQRKPLKRLGNNGALEIKNHPWMKDFEWFELVNQRIKPEFVPPKDDNFDAVYTNGDWDDHKDQIEHNLKLLDQETVQEAFKEYYHDEHFNQEIDKEKQILKELKPEQNLVNLKLNNNTKYLTSFDSITQTDAKTNGQRGTSLLGSTTNKSSNSQSLIHRDDKSKYYSAQISEIDKNKSKQDKLMGQLSSSKINSNSFKLDSLPVNFSIQKTGNASMYDSSKTPSSVNHKRAKSNYNSQQIGLNKQIINNN